MEIKGKINLFINEHKRADGSQFATYSCSLGGKTTEGAYINMPLEVKFDGKEFPEATLAKLTPDHYYVVDVLAGFLSVRTYTNKNGELVKAPYIVVQKAKVLDRKPVAVKTSSSEDLPF